MVKKIIILCPFIFFLNFIIFFLFCQYIFLKNIKKDKKQYFDIKKCDKNVKYF